MASSDYKNCNVCEAQSKTSEAVKWCFECEEAFCIDCLNYHSTSKFTRSHTPIDVENYRSLPAYVLEIKQYCDEHGDKFQNYCTTHDCPCCSKCIDSSHKTCNSLPSLHDVVQNARTSTALIDIEERLENLTSFFVKLRKEKEINISDLKSEKGSILAQIKQIRNTFNQHLDGLEKDIIRRLSEIETTHNHQIEKMCTELKKNEDTAIEIQDSIVKMKKYASDLQIFLGRRKLEAEVMKKEKMIDEISTYENLNTQHIIFQENAVIATLQSGLDKLGELSIVTRPSDTRKIIPKAKQAQIITTMVNNFDSLNLVIRKRINVFRYINVNCHGIYGCALTTNGEALFSDYPRKRLFVIDVQSDEMLGVRLPTNPYDITCIDDKTLAVTSGNAIHIVDMRSKIVKKTVYDTVGSCYGTCMLNGNLVFSTKDHGLKILDLSDYSISELNIGHFINDEYVTARNNKIYCTNNQTSSVTCYNPDNSVAWVFQNSAVKGPRGIAVDDRFNVYIGGQDSDNVIVISPDGQKYKELHLKINRPRTLYFDDKSKQILICGEKGIAGIFSITM